MGFTFRIYDAAARRRRAPVWVTVGALVFVAGFTVALAFLLIAGGGVVVGLIPLALLFALLLLFAAIRMIGKTAKGLMSIGAIIPAGSRVYLFDAGLVHSGLTRTGRHRERVFLWNEVSVLRGFHTTDPATTEPAPAHYTYTVKRPGGATVVLDHSYWEVADIQELGGAIIDRVEAAQVPQVLAAVRGGRKVRFGDFTVNNRGLRYVRSKMARWDRIETVYVAGDEITVRATRRFFNESRYSAGFVPNDFVLAAVAETLIRDAANHG